MDSTIGDTKTGKVAVSMRKDFLSPGWLVLVLAGILFALYPGVLLGKHTFFFQDYGLFTYPVVHYIRESFWRGEVPLWNPLLNCGVPFLAQWNTTVCYPLSLFYLIFPLPWSLNIFLLGHLLIAGVGMYFLARHWTQNSLAAFIAGLAYGMNGLMLNCLLWTSNLAALSWQPWVVLLVGRAWREGGGRRMGVAALVGWMQMLTGAPEIIIFTWVIILALWLVEVVQSRKDFLVELRRLAVLVILVSGLAAVQLLPLLELVRNSDRSASYELANAWPLPLSGVANFFVPQIHTLQSVLGTYQLADQYWTKSYYTGIGVMLLVLAGLGRIRERRFWVLVAGALFSVLLAFGSEGIIYDCVKRVLPFISFARYPIKFISATVFVLPLLAALTINSFRPGEDNSGSRAVLVSGVLVAVAIAGSLLMALALFFRWAEESWSVTLQSGLSRAGFLAGLVLAWWGWLRATGTEQRKKWTLALVGLVALDLATAGLRLHPMTTPRVFGPVESNMTHRPRFGNSRALVCGQTQDLLSRYRTANPVVYCAGMREALAQNNNLLEDIPKVDGFCSLRIKEHVEIGGIIDRKTNQLAGPLADFVGVNQVLFSDHIYEWLERTNVLPLVTAGQRPVLADRESTLKVLAGDAFEPRQEVYLPKQAQKEISGTNSVNARVSALQFSAHKITFTVEAEAATLAVVAQTYYHNWHAFVDGMPVQVWRANHAFQAVGVPAGHHQIALVYQDRAFKIGVIISGLTLALCFVALTGKADLYIRKRRVES